MSRHERLAYVGILLILPLMSLMVPTGELRNRPIITYATAKLKALLDYGLQVCYCS
jgi:hypothetical protein